MIRVSEIRLDYGRGAEAAFVARQDFRIEWAVAGDAPCAFRVEVTGYNGLLWNSGWVAGENYSCDYAGAPLAPGETYTLKLFIKSASGETTFIEHEFAYVALPEWRAQWIGEETPGEDRILLFKKNITVSKPLRSAAAFVCGIGYHRVMINGEAMGRDFMNPAFSEYEKRCYYQTLTGLPLRDGENKISVYCAAGWRSRYNVCYAHMDHLPDYIGDTMLSASIHLAYKDGSDEWIDTDSSWQYGDVAYANIFMGEHVDARVTPIADRPVKELPSPTQSVAPQPIAAVREHEVYSPVCISEIKPGVYGVDFGQNIAGVCRLRIPAHMEQGHVISIRHMEFLDEDGSLYLPNLRKAACEDKYAASGRETGADIFQPVFTYHGFRYCEVSGYPEPLTRGDIEAVSLYTDVASDSSFRCGSALVSAIHKNALQTEKANIHSILTDCPQRDERMGWMNDATVRFEETPYNFNMGRLFPKVVRDIMDAQGEDGGITCTAPFAFGSRPADPVCSSFLVAGWQAYLHAGNVDVLKDAYAAWSKWDDCLESHSVDGIVQYSYYGDWAGPVYACKGEENPVNAETPGILMSTGYHYFNNMILAKVAKVIGEDAAPHECRAAAIRESFLNKWWDAETGKVASGSQGAQSFSLWLGILPEDGREKAAKVLHDDLVSRDYKFTTGNLCTRYIMDALCDWGYVEDAWRLITSEEYPSFGYMIQQEATTVWERFELKKNPGMNSYNHPMYGAVDYWFYAYLCGIKPLTGGFRTVAIKPYYPEKLLSAQATVATPRGDITVRWVKRYGELHLYVTVPNGITANVSSPEGDKVVSAGFYHWHSSL